MSDAGPSLIQLLRQAQQPIDGYDPFAAEQFQNPAVAALLSGATKFAATPGKLMQPNPYPAGSEESSWYEDQRSKAGTDWVHNAALSTLGAGGMIGAPVSAGEKLLGASVRPYTNVPDSLMGFRRSGPQKAFDESAYPHVQNVEVTLPETSISARDTFRDQIKGMNADHAVERAWRNWPDALHITPVPPQ